MRLLQMAIVSLAISIIRLIIAVVVLMILNWRFAITALAIIPGVVAADEVLRESPGRPIRHRPSALT